MGSHKTCADCALLRSETDGSLNVTYKCPIYRNGKFAGWRVLGTKWDGDNLRERNVCSSFKDTCSEEGML